jgi:hypothetical protein
MTASSSSRTRLGSLATTVSLLSAVVIAMLLAIGSPAEAKKTSHITFAGLESATTCIGGPIGGGRTSSYHLGWQPATDRNARARIVYEVYQATAPGAEDFSRPTYTTARGATSFDTPQLRRPRARPSGQRRLEHGRAGRPEPLPVIGPACRAALIRL